MDLIIYFDCFSGASGDMLLGSLLDVGLPLSDLQAEMDKLPLSGYRLTAKQQTSHTLSGHKLNVEATGDNHPLRRLSDVQAIISSSGLSADVRKHSLAVFERLARAEAQVHGTTVQEVHFHEVGAVDSLVDIVGLVVGLELLNVKGVYASVLPLGNGFVDTAHGRLPLPAPATLALLAEAGAPIRPHDARTELVTPTAAALLCELALFERPAMRLKRVGCGLGSKELPWANALRVWIGQPLSTNTTIVPQEDESILLECNLDDTTGETLGYAMELLLTAGALDVWFTPIYMKKNRPATMLSVLSRPEQAATLGELMLRETTTLGLRQRNVRRRKAGRQMEKVHTPWGVVRVKVKLMDGKRVAAVPEYEDCARIARERNVPLHTVFWAARKAGDKILASA
ncbi:MAG: nickel pincer cofactor biosynthesis protein LarC [Chloroflexi bacterium]|nr:nickel pincer cofactor biosynthesis protein LarC [Chloroflexota bacterium]